MLLRASVTLGSKGQNAIGIVTRYYSSEGGLGRRVKKTPSRSLMGTVSIKKNRPFVVGFALPRGLF
jgi:hypothetical protein